MVGVCGRGWRGAVVNKRCVLETGVIVVQEVLG